MDRSEVENLLKKIKIAISDGRGLRYDDMRHVVSELNRRGWNEVRVVCVWMGGVYSGSIVHHPKLKAWRIYGGAIDYNRAFNKSRHCALQIPEHLFNDQRFVMDIKEVIKPLMAKQIARRLV